MLFEAVAPTAEPVSLAEAKLHLRLFHADEDSIVTGLIKAARIDTENFTHRAFVTQTWQQKRDGFPCDGSPIELPKAPLLSSTPPVITYLDANGDSQTWSSTYYTVDYPTGDFAGPGRIRLNYSQSYPTTRSIENAVTIQFVCGYGAATAVPEGIKAAIKILVAHWYANREPVVTGTIATPIPRMLEAMLWPFKVFV